MLTIKKYEITITVKSGLYIGGGDSNMRIGGVDNEFIKHPNNKMPYIPGSSLKGKVRSLLEYEAGIIGIKERQKKDNKIDGSPLALKDMDFCKDDKQKEDVKTVLKLFGTGGDTKDNEGGVEIGVTRLSFADMELSDEYKKQDVFEIKAETAIDRQKGSAKQGSLRFTERVGEGTEFSGVITMKVFDGDDKENFENTLFRGLKLLEADRLGGAGSRGYGRIAISFKNDELNKKFSDTSL